jgi:UPF0755 protein
MKKLLIFACAAAAALGAAWFWLMSQIAPTPKGEPVFVRFEKGTGLAEALGVLEEKGVVRSAEKSRAAISLLRLPAIVQAGTFEVAPGMELAEVMRALQRPVRRMVRIPEGWWIRRAAERLEREAGIDAEEYIKLAHSPAEFKDAVGFALPEKSLEGMLYPDTYDIPPLLPVRRIIEMQLRAFEKNVVEGLKIEPGPELERALIMGSIIELEAAKDEERPVIAGVIENRVRKNMTLDMDATVLYALQEWKALGPGVVRTVKSPYNTYLNRGLPPGPIGSPGAKSIAGALSPARHEWLFYVARPNRTHIFTRTYAEHRAAIRRARAEFRAAEEARN